MAETIAFDLVAPERRLAQTDADMVVVPGVEGEFGAMPRHAPVISALRPGLVSVHRGSAATEYVVTGGFAEVTGERITILADEAAPRAEVDGAWLAARADATAAAGDEERAERLRALARQLGV